MNQDVFPGSAASPQRAVAAAFHSASGTSRGGGALNTRKIYWTRIHTCGPRRLVAASWCTRPVWRFAGCREATNVALRTFFYVPADHLSQVIFFSSLLVINWEGLADERPPHLMLGCSRFCPASKPAAFGIVCVSAMPRRMTRNRRSSRTGSGSVRHRVR